MPRYRPDLDIVHTFCERWLAASPTTPVELVDRVRYELRVEYGGRRVYVSKGGDRPAPAAHRVTRPKRRPVTRPVGNSEPVP